MRRLAPALALYFLAPLVAEFLLGDFSIVSVPLIVVLAPMYGGGALLVREITRRAGRGWPTIAVALLTQSLFNPNYVDVHLLDKGFVPALGNLAFVDRIRARPAHHLEHQHSDRSG